MSRVRKTGSKALLHYLGIEGGGNAVDKIKDRHGFTLVELIISVGTLALIGILTIQFFMSAKDISRRTEELDHSVYLSNCIIESVKAGLWEETPLSQLKRAAAGAEKGRIAMKAFYDKNWAAVDQDSRTALFEVVLNLEEQAGFTGDNTLYELSLNVRRLKPYYRGKEQEPLLHSLDTDIYIKTLKEEMLR